MDKVAEELEIIEIELPSKVSDRSWLYVTDKSHVHNPSNVGKWMLFLKKHGQLDKWWIKIHNLILNGHLGHEAKVSTMMKNEHETNEDDGVIIIYTDNYEDRNDVKRVLDQLREIGVNWKIYYKTDLMTHNGIYRDTSYTASTYSSDDFSDDHFLDNHTPQQKLKLILRIDRNVGKPWSSNDIELFLDLIKQRWDLYFIAEKLGRFQKHSRPVDSIRNKFTYLAKNAKIADIYEILNNIKYIMLLSSLHSKNVKIHPSNIQESKIPDTGNCLIFDTEYTSDQYLLEIHWQIRKISDGNLIKQQYYLVDQNVEIDNSFIHGITKELIKNYGQPISNVLTQFIFDLGNVDCVVSHCFNSADYMVIMKELLRNKFNYHIFHNKPYDCTRKITKEKIKNITYSLDTIYHHLFQEEVPSYHTAIGDTNACAKIYYKLKYSLDTIEVQNTPVRPSLAK
jgi:hypothetical protein